jgi:hypothetical protein
VRGIRQQQVTFQIQQPPELSAGEPALPVALGHTSVAAAPVQQKLLLLLLLLL